jgi:hypothetical protein
MINNKIKVLIVVLVFLISFEVTFAAFSFGNVFGGRILRTEATEITTLEDTGYICVVPGSTIEIISIKGPTAYLIPTGITPKTNTTPKEGQAILGKYQGQATIVCTRKDGETTSDKNVFLDIITLFGTSRK